MKYVRCWTMKGVVIVQNALQGLETERKELMKGTKDINVLPNVGSLIPFRQVNDFLTHTAPKKSNHVYGTAL